MKAAWSPRLIHVGRPAVGIEVKIVDDEICRLPAGETGEIAVRGKNTMMGYWNKPELRKPFWEGYEKGIS